MKKKLAFILISTLASSALYSFELPSFLKKKVEIPEAQNPEPKDMRMIQQGLEYSEAGVEKIIENLKSQLQELAKQIESIPTLKAEIQAHLKNNGFANIDEITTAELQAKFVLYLALKINETDTDQGEKTVNASIDLTELIKEAQK
ncbi:MAG: hypothetical protein WDZ41_05890 [Candidatus Babeliales bacterium]